MQWAFVKKFRDENGIPESAKMYGSILEVKANFNMLCEIDQNDHGGVVVWIDYYNYFVNDRTQTDDELLTPQKANLNPETSYKNLCKNKDYHYFKHFFYQDITIIPESLQGVWKSIGGAFGILKNDLFRTYAYDSANVYGHLVFDESPILVDEPYRHHEIY